MLDVGLSRFTTKFKII